MSKERIIIAILSILLVATNIAWIFYHSQFIAEPEKSWIVVNQWGGDTPPNEYITDHFKITGEEWHIVWGASECVASDACEITVYDAYTDSPAVTPFTLEMTDTSERYLNLKGRFYLEMDIFGSCDGWYVRVYEYK